MVTLPVALFLLQVAATLFMTGLVWFVQIVHYPLMAHVGEAGFSTYSQQHAKRARLLIAPVMLAELATALLPLWSALRPVSLPENAVKMSLFLLALIWLSTALLQVPLHTRLSRGWDAAAARRLVNTNWIRTVCWTLRALLLLICLLV